MVYFNIRWGSPDGPDLDELKAQMTNDREPSWHYDPVTDEYYAALAWGVPVDEWDRKSPEDQGRMLETYLAQRTQRAWEGFVSRPKGKN